MTKPKAPTTTDHTEIEVVMRKKMTFGEYMKMLQSAKSKGWEVQSYQVGFYSNGLKNKLT